MARCSMGSQPKSPCLHVPRKEWLRMKTDIQIAQEAEMLHIKEVAAQLGIGEDDLELYGTYKAKLSNGLMEG